jgi:hypothetical protein
MPKMFSVQTHASLLIWSLALGLNACSPAAPLLIVPPKEVKPRPDPSLMARPTSSEVSSARVQANMQQWQAIVDALPTK